MIKRKKISAVSKAVTFLREYIEKNGLRDGAKLPSLGSLIKAGGVSRATMHKAIQLLVSDGVLFTVQGSGIFAGRPGGNDTEILDGSVSARSWEKTKEDLLEGILGGRYPSGSVLPSNKELQQEYGCGYRTVRRALQWLARKGILSRFKRSYRVSLGIPTPNRFRSSVVFASLGDRGHIRIYNPRVNHGINVFEKRCIGSGTLLRRFSIEKQKFTPEAYREALRDSLGTILWLGSWARQESYHSILRQMAAEHARDRIPLAVFDEMGKTIRVFKGIGSPHVALFTLPLRRAGREMAMYCIGRGHHRAAFLCLKPPDFWQRQRAEGFVRAFRETNPSFRAALFPRGREISNSRIVAAVLKRLGMTSFSAPLVSRIIGEIDADDTIACDYVRQRLSRDKSIRRNMERIHRACAWAQNLIDTDWNYYRNSSLIDSLHKHVQIEAREIVQKEYFQSILADRSITVWVGDCDDTALAALHFLRQRGIQVPEEIAVAGFDNSDESLRQNMTSFSFDIPSMSNRLFSHIVSPRMTKGTLRGEGRIHEVKGMVVGRATA